MHCFWVCLLQMQSKHFIYMGYGLAAEEEEKRVSCISEALSLKVDAASLKAYGKLRQLVLLLKSLVAALCSPKCLP